MSSAKAYAVHIETDQRYVVVGVRTDDSRLIVMRSGGIRTMLDSEIRHIAIETVEIGRIVELGEFKRQWDLNCTGLLNHQTTNRCLPSESRLPTPRPTIGYVVKGPDGPSTAIHQTREIAEAEAKRLAVGNTGKQFTVHPITREAAVSRAHTPKPTVVLEKIDG